MSSANHIWTDGKEEDALYGRVISEMRMADMTLIAVAVKDEALASGRHFDVIEMPGGLTLYVCIADSYIESVMEVANNDYAKGYTFGVCIGSLLTNIYHVCFPIFIDV